MKDETPQQRKVREVLARLEQRPEPVQWPRATVDDSMGGAAACYVVGIFAVFAAIAFWVSAADTYPDTILQQIYARLSSAQGTIVFCAAILLVAIGGLLKIAANIHHEIEDLRRDFRLAVDNMTKPAETP